MEKLPPRPQKVSKPKIHELTNDPLLRIVLAEHYDTDDKDYYRNAFQEEQDEILDSLYEMGFKEIKNEPEILNSDSNATNTTSPTSVPTIVISAVESSSSRENIYSATE